MKKILICLIFCLLMIARFSNIASAYSITGHEDFKKITFVNSDSRLLVDYNANEIEEALNMIKSSLFGWSTIYFNINEEANYEGVVIFSRSNKSNEVVKFDYVLNKTEVTETSVTVKGAVSTKITGTIKKINMTVNGEGEYIKENGNSYTSNEKTTLSFNVQPNKKLSLIVTGKCYVTTGVSKYRFLGITFKKGSWENIDVETIIYELREEDI